jgi:hypothetical protein
MIMISMRKKRKGILMINLKASIGLLRVKIYKNDSITFLNAFVREYQNINYFYEKNYLNCDFLLKNVYPLYEKTLQKFLFYPS